MSKARRNHLTAGVLDPGVSRLVTPGHYRSTFLLPHYSIVSHVFVTKERLPMEELTTAR